MKTFTESIATLVDSHGNIKDKDVVSRATEWKHEQMASEEFRHFIYLWAQQVVSAIRQSDELQLMGLEIDSTDTAAVLCASLHLVFIIGQLCGMGMEKRGEDSFADNL